VEPESVFGPPSPSGLPNMAAPTDLYTTLLLCRSGIHPTSYIQAWRNRKAEAEKVQEEAEVTS